MKQVSPKLVCLKVYIANIERGFNHYESSSNAELATDTFIQFLRVGNPHSSVKSRNEPPKSPPVKYY